MTAEKGHGWAFVSEDRIVHGGPLHLIRAIVRFNNTGDQVKAYDGLSATGRQVLEVFGTENRDNDFEIGIRLTTGLYVTLSSGSKVLIVFDPIEDE